MRLLLPLLAALSACAPDAPEDTGLDPNIPGHNECLPEGEEMTPETCLAVVEVDGRHPTRSQNKAGFEAPPGDTRPDDPEFSWLTDQVRRCTCACCHTASYGGPGVYFWDLEYAPFWIDSASLWSLSVFGGWTDEYEQTLPTADLDRVRAYLVEQADYREAMQEEDGW